MTATRKILVVSGTRADFGLLRTLIAELMNDPRVEMRLLITGSHLSAELGLTVQEIEAQNIPIAYRLPILTTEGNVPKATAAALVGVAEIIGRDPVDLMVVLGDRYESFAATSAAALLNVPVAHIHGGELTYGAVDDALRHAMTKMSWWHFTSAEDYRRRVIQLGESPERVFNVGALCLDNIQARMSQKELEDSVGFSLESPLALVTLHSETRHIENLPEQLEAFWQGLCDAKLKTVVITMANADTGGNIVNAYFKQRIKEKLGMHLVASLGHHRYLSMLKQCQVAIGNSSSLVIEAPILGVPSVVVGERQQGRIRAKSVIDVSFKSNDITAAIQQAISQDFRNSLQGLSHPFGTPGVAKRIAKVLVEASVPRTLSKGFYDQLA